MTASLNYGAVTLPRGWTVDTTISLRAPQDAQDLAPAVQITVITPSNARMQPDLEALRGEQAESLPGALPQFKLLERGTLRGPGGRASPFLAYAYQAGPHLVIKQVQVIEATCAGVCYVTATAPLGMFARHWPALKHVIESYLNPSGEP